MRRTLFGKSTELERLAPPRASVRDALLFDVRDHEASTDLTLAERRADSWTFAPWLLLAGHLILATTLLLQERPPASQAVARVGVRAARAVRCPSTSSPGYSCSSGAECRWLRTPSAG